MRLQLLLIRFSVLLLFLAVFGAASSAALAAPAVLLPGAPAANPEPVAPVALRAIPQRPVLPGVLLNQQPAAAAMSQGFEAAWPAAGWSTGDSSSTDGGEYTWGRSNCHPHTGAYGGWAVGGGAQGGGLACGSNYPNNANTWAAYGPIDLSKATAASLTFYVWGQSETLGNACADYLYVGSFTNDSDLAGGGWCGDATEGSAGNGYYRLTLDLGARLGVSRVWILFAFVSDETVTYPGFTIDDVTLDVAGLGPAAAAKSYLPLALAPGDSAPRAPTTTPTQTRTPNPAITATQTRTPQPTVTPTQTRTPQPTATPTRTRTPEPTPTPTPTRTPDLNSAFAQVSQALTTMGRGTIFGLDTGQCTFSSASLYIYSGPQPCSTPLPYPRSDAEREVLEKMDGLLFRAGYNLLKADYSNFPLTDASFSYPDASRLHIAFTEGTSVRFSGDISGNAMQVNFAEGGGNSYDKQCQFYVLYGQFQCPVKMAPQSDWSPLPVTNVVIRELSNRCIRVSWQPAATNIPAAAPAGYSLRLSTGGTAPFLNDIRAPGSVSTYDDCSDVATRKSYCGTFQDTVYAIAANGKVSSPAYSNPLGVCRFGQ